LLLDVSELQTDDPDDDQKDWDQSNNVIGIAKKENSADHRPCSADPCPYGICSSYRNALHRLRDGKETENNENDSDDARNDLCKSLAEFQGNGKADFKKACEQKKYPSNRHVCAPNSDQSMTWIIN